MIGFHSIQDELYWNAFTNYDAPVRSSTVTVVLPQSVVSRDMLQAEVYATTPNATKQIIDNQTFQFQVKNAVPGDDFTVAAAWPKGMVDQVDYWHWFVSQTWGYIGGIVFLLVTIMAILIYWLVIEHLPARRETIIPQYEPPRNLKPAMAEIIVKERSSGRTWPATLVDLAVRGYLSIEQEKTTWTDYVTHQMFRIIIVLGLFMILSVTLFPAGLFVGIGLVLLTLINVGFNWLRPTNYRLNLKKDFSVDSLLEDYEKEFLTILFGKDGHKQSISTKDLKKASTSVKQDMVVKMGRLQQGLYKEVPRDVPVYVVPPSQVRMTVVVLLFAFAAVVTLLILLSRLSFPASQGLVLTATLALSVGLVFLFIRYNPRLNRSGNKLRAEILGFKMYLQTAERYRLQNLTPDMFQQFLPYAMIFGVEKQWAKAFEILNISVQHPIWYGGGHGSSTGGISTSASSFSPAAFSSSFASSLSSAVSSSTGASGGGGSAGGGAGGGGGGAS